ncbi:MAG: hypothetical protein J6C62_00655 [Clostridia bacterium]|nr:hypothetical protein [Clostridia bacterium]
MTKYEVKEKLSEYYKACSEAECLKKRIEVLTASKLADSEVNERLEELNDLYKKAVLNADLALARTLKIINTLNNTDCDVDVLKKYHIDGLPEKVIAKQLCLSVDYIRTKRWRAYQKISKII